jgi:hypothetical protein
MLRSDDRFALDSTNAFGARKMHGHVNIEEFFNGIRHFLGGYYLFLAAMNGLASFYLWRSGQQKTWFQIGSVKVTNVLVWLFAAAGFTVFAAFALGAHTSTIWMISLPESVRTFIDQKLLNPMTYTVGSLAILWLIYLLRTFFVKPAIAWGCLNLSLLVMGLSMTDVDFARIVMKPDNVPIVAMIYLLGFFTWVAGSQAVENDRRDREGLEPLEKLENEKVLVWPDLVYSELICMVLLCAILIVWAIVLRAPLEEPASAVKTPNPSKAPWYFLGLQEMLVYYDPWMAGVVLPSLVVFGLMAIPFLDFNKRGNGYYTIDQRKFAYCTFQFGFLVLWVTLIVMGTFLRGPNWNFFGFYETWDAHKVEALNNVDLSDYFWIWWLERSKPVAPSGAGAIVGLGYILLREAPGFLLLGAYFGVLPPAMVLYIRGLRDMFLKMGFLRFMVLSNLLLLMGLLPLKMVLRWLFNLKYFIAIPEYFTNL